MQHPDNVDYPPLMSRPVVFAPALAMLFGLLWYVHLGSLAAKQAGVKTLADLPADVIGAALAAVLVALAWRVWVRLALRWQMALVWLGLAGLLLYFFYSFDLSFDFIRRKIGFLVTQGLVTTIYISAISIVLASLLAMVGAIAKLSQNGVALGVANFYTSLFRGTPLLMQLYMIYLGLPQLGIVIGPIPAGVAALSLCYGAYMTEIFRAGIENIPRGQWEAARALGIKPFDTLARIILPQAMRIIIPPTGNQFIAMLKDSSLVSVVGVWELMYLARTQGQTEFRHLEMMITAALIYWLLSMVLEVLQARLERHFNRAHMR
ncbi:amino acid ABC transporter permease [Phenylobacterium montanum]|uniref:Glutamate/aspartate import permease protein GltK n=1 Tax=Phenylobacterium montanum TaxID=2823693 RepID=A0A975G0M4_9CAUL|nr:amino acid ABC transporter permease [Caulobacter sp. S6]QUD87776.1 amino acid ABC transporter permease [Caulobacter sp. S6]